MTITKLFFSFFGFGEGRGSAVVSVQKCDYNLLMSVVLKFFIQVPFRLTRMLVKAMEVSGIEGNFRSTCENVMQVLRSNKDSVMAMMEV